MPPLPRTRTLRTKCLLRPLPTSTSSSTTITARTMTTTPSLRSASGGHEDHYDPPSGWLFGVPPGQKYEKQGWENIWMYGFFGSLAAAGVALAYKPDTSIQTWALEEARRRLEKEGILEDPDNAKK